MSDSSDHTGEGSIDVVRKSLVSNSRSAVADQLEFNRRRKIQVEIDQLNSSDGRTWERGKVNLYAASCKRNEALPSE